MQSMTDGKKKIDGCSRMKKHGILKKSIRFCVIFLLFGAAPAMGVFLLLAQYYQEHFPVNTWINGVYCTGKTVAEVNEELACAQEANLIHILDSEGTEWVIPMEEAEVRPDYTQALMSYLNPKDMFYWLKQLQMPVSDCLAVSNYVADEEKLRVCFEMLPFVAGERDRAAGVKVVCTGEEYYLQDDNIYRLNRDKAFGYLKESLSQGRLQVDLLAAGCYEDLPDSGEDKLQRTLWAQIVNYRDQSSHIAYDMGTETIELTFDVTFHFLKKDEGTGLPLLDENGSLAIEEQNVRFWLEQLAEKYNTYGTEREFAATRGDVVKVKYGTYGTKLDVEAETAYLTEVLRAEGIESQVHVPTYLKQGYVRGLDDIGGTYIEIDMTEQKMYYYVEGELSLETDVVTGHTGGGHGTPSGIYYVYAKERNRILRGPGYASFVKYWMPVRGGIGIHDANWRSVFGGTIYKTNGSHGCINTPTAVMTQLYDGAEIGTPVIMFY